MRFTLREHGLFAALLAVAGFVAGLPKPAEKPQREPVPMMPAMYFDGPVKPEITNIGLFRRGSCANGQCGVSVPVAGAKAMRCVAGCDCPDGDCTCDNCPLRNVGHVTATHSAVKEGGRCGVFSGMRERIGGRIDRRQSRRAGRRG